MDDQFRKFIAGALHIETIADFPTVLELSKGRGGDYGQLIHSEFRKLLDEQSLSVQEWNTLTYVEFENKDDLYRFLNDLYAYLYEGRSEPPELPD